MRAAVELSAKYINDRYLPDKAIDVIDEAGANTRLHYDKNCNEGNEEYNNNPQSEIVTINKKDIEKIISSIAKIPEQSVDTDDVEKLKSLNKVLMEKIFGQDKAIEISTRAIKRSRAGFNEENKPVASLTICWTYWSREN